MAVLIVILGLGLTVQGGVIAPGEVELEMTVTAPDGTTWTEDHGLFPRFDRSVPEDPHYAHNISVDFRVETAARDYGAEPWQITLVPHGIGRDGVNYTLSWSALAEGDQVIAQNQTRGTIDAPQNVTFEFSIPEDTWAVTARLEYQVPDRTSVPLGQPLAWTFLTTYVVMDDELDELLLHPTAVAGWTAIFITGIMLLPVGRFDGGAIARAMLGHRMPILAWVTVAALAVLALFYAGWVYLILIIVLFFNIRHPTPLDDTTPLSHNRQWFALILLALFAVCFVPLPSTLAGLGFLG
jgi:hypothetical protein